MTSLVGHLRVSKSCQRLESYGTVDELNSHIGLLINHCTDRTDRDFLTEVQAQLFVVGGYLATDNAQTEVHAGNVVSPQQVAQVEQEIDRLQTFLQPLCLFILPGGCRAAAQAHVCRTVCRRAEREIIRLTETGADVDDPVMAYVNRLSDYFFTLARKLNLDAGIPDVVWRKSEK